MLLKSQTEKLILNNQETGLSFIWFLFKTNCYETAKSKKPNLEESIRQNLIIIKRLKKYFRNKSVKPIDELISELFIPSKSGKIKEQS